STSSSPAPAPRRPRPTPSASPTPSCAGSWGSRRSTSRCRSRPRRSRSPTTAAQTPRRVAAMRKLQSQGVHHITIVGADRQTSIDFWEGVLGMPFVFEQPNLDNAADSHLYFDPGDGRLITIFTNEDRVP